MLKNNPVFLIEIYKPERGGMQTLGWSVAELPLFNSEILWIYPKDARTEYVLDVTLIKGICPSLGYLPLELIELCNKKWDECIHNKLDFISFKYEYDSKST